MQAIKTKFFGPTDSRGSRIRATCEAGTIFVEWDHALDVEKNHHQAVRALMKKLGWANEFLSGETKTEWVHTLVPRDFEVLPKHKKEMGIRLAQEAIDWARMPRNHGGNPYFYAFVRTAREMIGDSEE